MALDFEKTATRVSLVSVAGNAALSLFKLLAGVLAHSGAMISDAVHSVYDDQLPDEQRVFRTGTRPAAPAGNG